jgi:hypothetical protein
VTWPTASMGKIVADPTAAAANQETLKRFQALRTGQEAIKFSGYHISKWMKSKVNNEENVEIFPDFMDNYENLILKYCHPFHNKKMNSLL